MNDVRPAKFANEQRPVPQLGDDRADVLDAKQPIDWAARHRVDRDDPRVDRALSAPCIQQPERLYGMAANDALRSDYDGNPERLWQGILHTAEGSRRLLGARHTPVGDWLPVCAYRSEITPPKS